MRIKFTGRGAAVTLRARLKTETSMARSSTCCSPRGVTWPRPGGSSPGRCSTRRMYARRPSRTAP